jgi:hypothetical protein
LQGIRAAATLFQQAIAIDPHYAAPHASLGRIDAVEGRYEDAGATPMKPHGWAMIAPSRWRDTNGRG